MEVYYLKKLPLKKVIERFILYIPLRHQAPLLMD